MDKDIAVKLLSLSKSIDIIIVSLFAEVDKISDHEQRKRFNRSVGDLMGFIDRDLIMPIENIFPELKTGPR
jgi:hypothetical protein